MTMTLKLLRNCSHGSEICTYLVWGRDSRKIIIKSASTAAGIVDLEREIEGWEFYQMIRYPNVKEPLCKIVQKRKKYIKIAIEFIEGINPTQKDYKNGLAKNVFIISKVVDHYLSIWPYHLNKMSALHGDLSLDNIIFNEDGIHIVDWEHYQSQSAPWGFDILFFLYETLWFGMRSRNDPTEEEINFLSRYIYIIKSSGRMPIEVINQPLRFLHDFITNNLGIWGPQLLNFPKLVILGFSDSQIFVIDKLVREEVKKL